MNTRPRKARHLLLVILIAVIAILLLPTKVQSVNGSQPKAASMKNSAAAAAGCTETLETKKGI